MAKLIQTIEYGASQSMSGGYKPSIYHNGKWLYSITRNAKTMRGAISKAKKLAEEYATQFPKMYNEIIIKEREK